MGNILDDPNLDLSQYQHGIGRSAFLSVSPGDLLYNLKAQFSDDGIRPTDESLSVKTSTNTLKFQIAHFVECLNNATISDRSPTLRSGYVSFENDSKGNNVYPYIKNISRFTVEDMLTESAFVPFEFVKYFPFELLNS